MRVRGWFLALFAVLICAASTQAAIKYTLQGESNPTNGVWVAGNLSGWGELDFAPCRVDMTGGPATNLAITVNFPRFVGTVPGIEDLYNWSGTTNVIFVSGPTLTTSTGTTWTYSMTVTITNAAEADIFFYARLASGCHAVGGSSMALGGTPSSMGNLQISKPNVGNGQPDLGVVKTGPTLANAGELVTYSLSYTNSTNNAAVGVQLADTLPTGSTFVSASVPANTNGNIVVCDLGVVDKNAVGVVSVTVLFSSGYVSTAKITNNVTIATSDNDVNSANNSSSWVTTIVTGCVPVTVGAQPQSISVCSGSSGTVSVGANGTAPLSYQWYKNGSQISGATASAYTIASASTNDAGSYSVVVTNACGTVTSAAATVTLNATTAATGPSNSNVCPGGTATLATTASGTAPFTYVWLKNGATMSGQTNSSITLTNASPSDMATYSVIVTGTCSSVTNSAFLTVNTLASSPGLTSITNNCSGTMAAFVEVVNGTGPFAYVWKKNGTVIGGQTSSAYVIASTALGDAGTYTVEVTGLCNSITNSATLAVAAGTFGTALTNLVLCPGSAANFSTVASGAGPYSYQWRKNGSDISGQTTSAFSIGSVALGDSGTYSVEISGNCNKITNSATLSVNTPLSGGAFGNQTVCAGQSATFTTTPAGSGPFIYVWKKDGVAQGSSSNSITVVSAAAGDAGSYSVEISGMCNSVTNSAVLTVNTPTTASALASLVRCPGQSATFSTVASGTGPLTYVWKKDGVVQSSTASSLTVASVAASDAGTYTVEVSGGCNNVTNSATLTVNAVTTATALTSATNCVGDSVTFSTTASGMGPFSYVWTKDGVAQSSTTNSLTVSPVSVTDAGTYSVEITGTCTSVTNTATLRVNAPATATALTTQTVCEGQSASFSTTASGTGPFTYVWKKDGVDLGNASSSLTIASATIGDAGTYSVEVTGSCNSVTNSAILTVNALTSASALNNQTVCAGQSVTFATTASGAGPLTFVWKKDGIVQASTTSALTIGSVASGDAGTYTVEVSGTCNSVTNTATLTVNSPTTASPLASLTLCPGQSATFTTVASGTGPLTYVWKKDGVVQASSTDTLTIASVAASDAGNYTVEVTGTCNSVTNSATLTVNDPTTATPLTDIITCGQSATFATVVSGTGPFTYVWKKDGVVQSSATNSLTIASVASGDAGTYTVEVTGLCDSVTNSATLTLNADTTASALGDQTVCEGQSTTFSTVVSGSGPFTYVWKKDGVVQGSTTNSLTVASAVSTDAGTYTVEIGGACNSVTNSAVLTVNTATTSSALSSLVVCPGQSATFTTVPAGTGPFTYVWRKDGAVQSSTTNVLAIASATAADAGSYTVEVTGACNSVTNVATLTVNENTAATSLTDLMLCPGQTATFTTTVSGTGPFGFVWKKDGVVLSGETTNTLSVAGVTAADAGAYTVEVSGVCNSVTNTATLTVNENVAATALSDTVVCEGQAASFATTVSGTGPFTYVWKKDGAVLATETGSSISIASAQLSDSGVYTVEVSGVCTSVTNSANLTVNSTTTTSDLTSLVLCPGQNATFTTVASGTGPFTYVWSKDGQVIGGETTDHITITGVAAANAGTYSVHVTGTCNSVDTSATLTVNEDTAATSLTDLVLCPGQTATFTTTVSGTGPFGFVWKKDGVVLSGQTTNSLSVVGVTAADAGAYTVEVSGVCNSVTNAATLTVNENVAATALSDTVVCEGQAASFATTASGTGPFTYVWKKDGSVLASETGSSISIASAQLTDAGVYTVEVTGVCTAVTNSATLTVNQTTATSDLVGLTLCPGQNATFTTVASGTGPFSYVWSKDGQVIGGETTDHITINGVAAANAGTYSVHVTGTCNSVDTSATLTVNENTSASALTSSVLCPGQSATFTTVASGTGPLTYVWKKDGVVQASATNVLTIGSVASDDAGTYTVEITGTCTSVTNSATLTVNENTSATSLTSLVLCPGQPATFTMVASGTGPFTYVWKKDGVVQGSTSNVLTIVSVASGDAGSYTVEVNGTCTSVTNVATLVVNENVAATSFSDVVLCPGQTTTFATAVTGTGPFGFVWKKDGVVINGQTTNSLNIGPVSAADAGTYTVEVSGVCNSVTNSAVVTVNENVSASALTDVVVCQGQPAAFSTTPSGTGPYTFVWKKDGAVLSGETNNSITIASADLPNAGSYTVEVSGVCTSVTNGAILTVNSTATASDLISLTLCPGQDATFTTVASGTGPFSYVWSKDGQVIGGETTDHITISSVISANAGTYSVHITGTCNSVDKSATLAVNENTTASELLPLTLCPGQTATFTTAVSGTGPFGFVWKKDGVVLAGQTTNTLTVDAVNLTNAGTYTVEVSGTCNSVTNSALLSVLDNVTSTALTDATVCQGQPVGFSTTTAGTGPFTYVWKKDGNVLSAETNSSISIAAADVNDAGLYTVEVTGVCTSATNSATLTVNLTTTTSDLASLTLCPGQNATFATVASGTGPFSYVWSKDGQVISGETTDHLTISGVASANAGTYSVHVTGTCNSVDKTATLTVNENTTASELSPLILCPGQAATFTTTVSGTGPFEFVWKKDGTVLAGETTNTLTVASVTAADAGAYTVEVTGVCTSVTNSASLTVNQNVSATALTDLVVCENQPATFSTIPSGTGPFTYVWKKDGSALLGQTNSSISIASAQVNDAGAYTVEVTGVCTSVTNSANLTVNRLTTTSDLASLVLCPGQDAAFATVASGTGPFSYVWSKDGQVINGETNDHITITGVAAASGGTYSVHVIGTCNNADKSATLTVNENTSASALTSLVVCPNQPATFLTIPSGTGPFSYVWKKDGVVQSSISNSLVILSANSGDAGSYTVEVTGACTSVTNSATLTLNTNASATALLDLVRCPGAPATFSTIASGTGPFTYVWRKDGNALNGETNNSISLASVANSDAGIYSVEVSGTCNTVTNSATLVVNTNVSATALVNINACPDTTSVFSTVATGTGPITYQWSKDGQNLTDQTNASLTIAKVSTGDSGVYSVVVSGACNAVTNSATLSVGTLAATPLSNLNSCQGQPVTFSTVASGTGPFGYVWKKNGSTIFGATTSSYTIPNPLITDAGTYSVVVSSTCLSVTNSATLSIGQAITASALVPITRCPGQSATFTTAVGGSGPFAFVWKQNGQVLGGQTSSALTLNPLSNANSGTYTVEVTGFCNSVTNSATLTVKTNATTSPIGDYSVCAGQSVTFTTTPAGTPPFAYRWRRNGSVVSGATTSALTIASASTNNAGTYSVEVTGTCNTATNFGSLNVAAATSITHLTDQNICSDGTNVIVFSTVATGGAPFTYTWSTNGTIIAGQNSSVLTLTNVPPSTNAYVVSVDVTGGCGSASSTANLMVYDTTIVTGSITFTSGQDIVINDNQPATPYPANLFVHCIPGVPKKVRVTLLNVTHTYPKDINAMVVSPTGQAVPLMVECGGEAPISFVTLTFDDDASSALPQNGPITSGNYKPTTYLQNSVFPSPAPTPNAAFLSSLAGQDPTGTWSLYVFDDEILDDGFMKGGWALTLIYGDETPSMFIDSAYLGDDTFQTTLVGPAGLVHIVQSSTDMVNWTSIATNSLPTGSFTLKLPVTPQGPKEFYRAIRPF